MQKKQLIESSRTKSVSSCGLKHGDRLYLNPKKNKSATLFKPEPVSAGTSSSSNNSSSFNPPSDAGQSKALVKVKTQVEEHQVDVELSKMDGKITRKRDALHCQHNQNSLCIHCCPLEPYNE